jgi:DNA processing protein
MDAMERRVVAALWSLPGVGVKAIAQVRAAYPSLDGLLERPLRSWVGALALGAPQRQGLATVECLAQAHERLDAALARHGYDVLFPGDPGWPPPLRGVSGAPPVLFKLGPGADAPARRRVAVVGTRTPESGSTREIRRLVSDIAAAGVGVVSGAAEGIDRVAHLGALDAGGETWAFLGCAIEEMDAAQAVLRRPFLDGGGTFFSQFPPGTRPDKGHFVQRNALISGAAEAVLVARAPRKSGALITVERGRAQGRPILAVPGDPWNAAAEGSNALLRQGARPCLAVSDVLSVLGLDDAPRRPPPAHAPREALSPSAQRVLGALSRVATPFDELLAQLGGVSAGDLSAALLELELSGDALQRPGKRYEKVA